MNGRGAYPGAGYRPGDPRDHGDACGCSACCWAKVDRLTSYVGWVLAAVIVAGFVAALVLP